MDIRRGAERNEPKELMSRPLSWLLGGRCPSAAAGPVVNKAVKMTVQVEQQHVLVMKHVYPPLCVAVVTHTGVCLSSLVSSNTDLIFFG